jgi:DNA adenine methylase
VFIDAKQNVNPFARYRINDLNYDLFCFWKYAQQSNEELYQEVKRIRTMEKDGRVLFQYYTSNQEYTDFERAVRFYVLNRITFSGTVDSGGYSEQAFEKRFTISSVERIKELRHLLNNVEISHSSYESLLFEPGNEVFIFLDPPYYSQSKSKLYGNKGDLHTAFNHKQFAENMQKCKHQWLITLDDCQENRELFNFANIYEWELQYGMNNYKQGKADKGKELFISNYEINIKAILIAV